MNPFDELKQVKTLLVDDDEFIEKPFSVKALISLLALSLKRQQKKQTATL